MTAWDDEIKEEKEADKAEFRQRQIEGYAKLHNVDIEEVIKQFKR